MSASSSPVAANVITNIELKSHQVKPYKLIHDNFCQSTSTLICAPTGSGKTVVAIKLAKSYGMTLFVIGPANVESTWVEEEAKKYGINIVFISYTMLAGRKNSRTGNVVISHSYLVHNNDEYYPKRLFRNSWTKGYFSYLTNHKMLKIQLLLALKLAML